MHSAPVANIVVIVDVFVPELNDAASSAFMVEPPDTVVTLAAVGYVRQVGPDGAGAGVGVGVGVGLGAGLVLPVLTLVGPLGFDLPPPHAEAATTLAATTSARLRRARRGAVVNIPVRASTGY